MQETLHVFRATMTIYHLRLLFASSEEVHISKLLARPWQSRKQGAGWRGLPEKILQVTIRGVLS